MLTNLQTPIWFDTHSSVLVWRIPGTGEPGGLPSMGSHRVGHDWATSLWLFTFMHWRRKWQTTPVFCLENPRDGGAWWAAVYGVTQGRTRLKWLAAAAAAAAAYCYLINIYWIFVICQLCLALGFIISVSMKQSRKTEINSSNRFLFSLKIQWNKWRCERAL